MIHTLHSLARSSAPSYFPSLNPCTPSYPLVPRPLSKNVQTPQGHNPDAICMRHTLDPVVPFTHRPLALYALFGLSRLAVRCLLSVWGFRRRVSPCGTFCYWYREAIVAPGNGDANGARGGCITGRDPIVFFHGLGFGLASYALAVWKVCHGRVRHACCCCGLCHVRHDLLFSPEL